MTFQKAKIITVHQEGFNRQSRFNGSQFKSSASSQSPRKYYVCSKVGHIAKECPQQRRAKPVESPGQSGAASKYAHHVTSEPSTTQGRVTDLCKELQAAEINEAMKEKTATMHVLKPHVMVDGTTDGPALGPTIYVNVLLEGQPLKALVDAGSPVTTVSTKCLLDVLENSGFLYRQWKIGRDK